MSSSILERLVSGQMLTLVSSNTVDLYAEEELVKISLQTIDLLPKISTVMM